MTEFKRTSEDVDLAETLVQVLLDGGKPQEVDNLAELLRATTLKVDKLHTKALESDPVKQIFGPKMRENVLSLVSRWQTVKDLARDVLSERGVTVADESTPTVQPEAKVQVAQPETPTHLPIKQMDKLLETVNSVFIRFGFKKESNNPPHDDSPIFLPSHGLLQLRYVRKGGTSIVAHYVQMQNDLIVYAAEDGLKATPGMVQIQLGMSTKAVQAKVDSLLIYPIAYCCCVPALSNVPADVILNFLVNLAVPTIGALGCASRSFSTKVFENDELWWQVLSAFPPSDHQRAVMASLTDIDSAGSYRHAVKSLVEQQRAEQAAAKRQKREEEEMRSRFQPPHPHPDFMPCPPGGFPGGYRGGIPAGFPGGMPRPGIIGGDYDLTPGVGFMGNRGQRAGPGGFRMIGGDYDMFPGGEDMFGGTGRGPMGGGRNPFGGNGMFNGGGSNGMFNGGI